MEIYIRRRRANLPSLDFRQISVVNFESINKIVKLWKKLTETNQKTQKYRGILTKFVVGCNIPFQYHFKEFVDGLNAD